MSSAGPQRARSAAANKRRERAILDAVQSLGAEREVTLTDIAAAVGMHKSAMLRYFQIQEQIFPAGVVDSAPYPTRILTALLKGMCLTT